MDIEIKKDTQEEQTAESNGISRVSQEKPEASEDSTQTQSAIDDPGSKKPVNMKQGVVKIREWLNKTVKVQMSDKRVLIGVFLCTDRDANIILGSCAEYLPGEDEDELSSDEPRMLGLVMIPGRHIVSIHIDQSDYSKPKRIDVGCGQEDISDDIV